MRKLPPNSEAANILVGEMSILKKPIAAFLRLKVTLPNAHARAFRRLKVRGTKLVQRLGSSRLGKHYGSPSAVTFRFLPPRTPKHPV